MARTLGVEFVRRVLRQRPTTLLVLLAVPVLAVQACSGSTMSSLRGSGGGGVLPGAGGMVGGTGGGTVDTGGGMEPMAVGGTAGNDPGPPPPPDNNHPRLWVTKADLPTMQSWAVASNPMYSDIWVPMLADRIKQYDTMYFPNGKPANPFPDDGGPELTLKPTEELAAFFAFASLITTDTTKKNDYVSRAHTLLMYGMNEAAKGASAGAPFRDPTFSRKDRARWSGELWPLTVDWIYGSLSATDKATIRTAFLRWAGEQVAAAATVRPVGVQNDPVLTADKTAFRSSANNYYQASMRNLLFEANVLQPEDDPDGALHAYQAEAIGGMLYQTNALFQSADASDGIPVEGAFFYGQESISFTSMALLGLYTAGLGDTTMFGPQVGLATSDYWDKMLQFYPNAIASAPDMVPGLEYLGPVYWAAEMEQTQDQIVTSGPLLQLGPVALIARRSGKHELERRILWFVRNVTPGGIAAVTKRGDDSTVSAILSFLLFAPGAAEPPDYRPLLQPYYWGPGVRRLEARTGWAANGSWFGYTCNWKWIDHQNDICGAFHFFRKGEWITKTRTGYSNTGLIDTPDYWNAIGVQNTPVDVGYQQIFYDHGGPFFGYYGDPSAVASVNPTYAYVQGDSTNSYQSDKPVIHDVSLVSRSILWLKPDTVVIYDRATTKTAGRFKRFNLNLPSKPVISGSSFTSTTAKGQLLRVDSVLPAGAVITTQPWENDNGVLAAPESMVTRIRIEPAGTAPQDVRFLTVLQTTDGGDPGAPALLQVSGGDGFQGTVVGTSAVLFSTGVAPASAAGVSFKLPPSASHAIITGLAPGATYDATVSGSNVTVMAGTMYTADQAGVISF